MTMPLEDLATRGFILTVRSSYAIENIRRRSREPSRVGFL